MDIQSINLNSPLRVYYKTRNLTSGQDVVFSIWTSGGLPIVENVAADGEIGDRGVYYLDITTPDENTYLLVKGSLASGEDVATSVYAVGSPSRKAFYVDPRYQTGKSIRYTIFDINAAKEVHNKPLTDVAGGFYYADINEIDSQEDLFFKVGHYITQFDLRQLVVVSGGVFAGGVISVYATYVEPQEPRTYTGVIVSGAAAGLGYSWHEIAEGGAVADGIAILGISSETSGGAVVDGAAIPGISSETSGGAVVDGAAIPGISSETSGGAVVDGVAIPGIGSEVSGGVLANGDVAETAHYNITSLGGATLDGAATPGISSAIGGGVTVEGEASYGLTITEVAEDGAVLSGQVLPIIGWLPSGGVVVNGVSVEQATYVVEGESGSIVSGAATPGISSEVGGGIVLGTLAVEFAIYNIIPQDGVVLSGEAEEELISDTVEASGGAVANGAVVVTAIYDVDAESGAVLNGSATVSSSDVVEVEGGAVASGQSEVQFIASDIMQGGAVLNGTAIEQFISTDTAQGGIVVNGVAIDLAIFTHVPEDGAVLSGDYYNRFSDIAEGGILASGEFFTWLGWLPQGGVVAEGEAEVTDDYWNYDREKVYRYKLGSIVYLRYPASRDYVPSHYEQHQVEGVRIFGNHNLYDIGIGILVDEDLLVDDINKIRLQSEEANYTIEYSGNKIDRLEDLPVLSDPLGGELFESDEITDISTADEQAAARSKHERLSRLSPLSDPVGGEIEVTSTESSCCRLPNKIKNRLKAFQNMQALPNPRGGTMQFSEAETPITEVAASIEKKLSRLRGASTLPTPNGGIMSFSETDGQVGVDVSTIRKKREQLDGVAMIPDPTGAYILVSMDLGSENEELKALQESAAKKLKKLIGV